ncbi:hypothetical protein [Methylobacterium oryzisoli]|uniref:hypothetical protein n=1 Tax=Methylobacterium oryzisoli TaxID=3385502 RepID=UPI0038920246
MTAGLAPRPRSARPRQRPITFAERLVLQVCRASPDPTYLKRLRTQLTRQGIRRAVAQHDTPALFNWLVEVASYQGIADTIAWTYMQQHGRVRWADLQAAFSSGPKCPKLASFEAFHGCRYRKASHTCAHPEHLPGCPLPTHPLRKGSLNQAAYALYLFMRDECRGDLVAWIDAQLAAADQPGALDRAQRMREALLRPLAGVHGFGPKVASMAFAELLLGTDPKRERWLSVGSSLIVVDTLVHNWLHRTGILQRLDAEHAYGPACYRPGGCAEIIEALARRIDARQFNPAFPAVFPRYLQKAIWAFCAENGLGICNGNQIDDSQSCTDHTCYLSSNCRRIALRSAR